MSRNPLLSLLQRPPRKRWVPIWVKLVVAALFMCVWITGMSAAMTAGACRNPDKPDADRLRACDISILLGNLFPGEGPKRAGLYLERGILHANMGQQDPAWADMNEALARATEGQVLEALADYIVMELQPRSGELTPTDLPHSSSRFWLGRLVGRMAEEPDDGPAARLWTEVLIAATRDNTPSNPAG